MPKILFLTTAHNYNDDRIFYHQAKTLLNAGNQVKICSLSSDFQGITGGGVEVESYSVLEKTTQEKMHVFETVCNDFEPDCIICSEPLAVFSAQKYQKKKKTSIVYDITEWYPAMSMLAEYSFPLKLIHAVKFFLIQLYAGFVATHFIFGEETKKFPLAYFFPFKRKMILPYYPDYEFVSESVKKLNINEIVLCYTGAISKDKGIDNFFNAVKQLQKLKPNLKIKILIIGSARKEKDEKHFLNLVSEFSFEHIEIQKPSSFQNFTQSFEKADVCFDLRELNFENHHSLPIKLFYYMGAGKPIIYSNLKGIRKHLDVSGFGNLVDPKNSVEIANLIVNYLENPTLYDLHAKNARKKFEEIYNWSMIKDSFLDFVKHSIPNK